MIIHFGANTFPIYQTMNRSFWAVMQAIRQPEFNEGSKHMSKGTAKEKRIIALAYFHRYGWIAIMTGMIFLIPQYTLLIVGFCFIATSLWSLIGYKLKWKHIYCSHQNAHRKDMTPHHICWTHIKKSEAYGAPVISLVVGVALFVVIMLC